MPPEHTPPEHNAHLRPKNARQCSENSKGIIIVLFLCHAGLSFGASCLGNYVEEAFYPFSVGVST